MDLKSNCALEKSFHELITRLINVLYESGMKWTWWYSKLAVEEVSFFGGFGVVLLQLSSIYDGAVGVTDLGVMLLWLNRVTTTKRSKIGMLFLDVAIMETFSALLPFCAENSQATGEFPAQRPATRSFDVYFDLRQNKRLSKQWWVWWFETPLRPLWRHCNVLNTTWSCQQQRKHQSSTLLALCGGNQPVIGELSSQRTSNGEKFPCQDFILALKL